MNILRPLDIPVSLCVFLLLLFIFFAIFTEAPVAQWVKGWPAKLAAQVQVLLEAESFSTIANKAKPAMLDGWMTCDFTSFSTVFQSY